MKQYYYQEGGKSYGPFTKKEIRSKNLPDGTYIWFKGLDAWIPIERAEDLRKRPKNISTKTLVIVAITAIGITVISSLISTISKSRIDNEIRAAAYDDSIVDFSVYMDKFYRDLEIYGLRPQKPKTCIIKFSEIDKIKGATDINGVSFGHNNDGLVEIYINPTFWQQASKAQRYWLMYHELAHDLLNVEDLPATPANMGKLMYPHSSSFDVLHMDEFIEAFHNFFESL